MEHITFILTLESNGNIKAVETFIKDLSVPYTSQCDEPNTKSFEWYFNKELNSLGIKTIPSVANFITTVWDNEEQAEKITTNLLKKGIVVRNLHPFGWSKCIRISIGTDNENQKMISTLKGLIS